MTGPLVFALLIAVVVMFVLLVRDPIDYGDYDDYDEHETMNGPGLPHHRSKK